ncbi:MAG TPA: hypothetical protein VKV36_01545, partial [Acidimicrobiales bacterium]|nr:hypothetical protein [Acidimicrobiales bacterium]
GRSEPLAGQGPAPPPPPLAGQPGPAARRGGADRGAHAVSLTPEELCAESGLSAADLAALEGFGLLSAATVAGAPYYDEEALDVARLLVRFSRYGIEPRHLRLYRNAVEREVGLVEQVVTPLLRQRNPEARQRAHEAAGELAELGERLRASLLRRELQRLLGT